MRKAPRASAGLLVPSSGRGSGCPICTAPVVQNHPNKVYCSDRCARRAYQRRRRGQAAKPLHGIDSETRNDAEGRASLTLVACSDGSTLEQDFTTPRILDYILERRAELWTFFGDYDINFWLRDLPPSALDRLRETNWTYWQDWRVHHIPRRIFEVWHKKTKRYACIYDVFPFVQSSFVRWLEDWKILPAPAIRSIAAMKEQRSDFSRLSPERIRRYTMQEVEGIRLGVLQLKARIAAAGCAPSRWMGPGAVAARVLRDHKVKDYMPRKTHHKADKVYFGGRVETSAVGMVNGPIFYYDINSAYPAACVDLPCFRHGKWEPFRAQAENRAAGGALLVQVSWKPRGKGAVLWGPLPVRLRPGLPLRYPASGKGWFWVDEVRPWVDSPLFKLELHAARIWRQTCKHQPFDFIPELYAKRQELKRANDPAEYAIKLVLNSCYGKLAQRTGQHPFLCLEWAGLITARTRGRLGEILVKHGEHVLIVATDGVITNRELPLQLGKGLGEWDLAGRYKWADIWQPGFYVLEEKVKTRGFTRHEVDVRQFRQAWRESFMLGTVEVTRQRVMGYRLGSHLKRYGDIGRWTSEASQVSFLPMPRRGVDPEVMMRQKGASIAYRTIAPEILKTPTAKEAREYLEARKQADMADDGEPQGYFRD